jgi:hypothetical protein
VRDRALHLTVAALVVTGCAHLPPFHPYVAEQAVPNDPRSATAESGGVRFTVHPNDWDAWPEDLEDSLTPVQVVIENDSGHDIRLRPSLFGLVAPNGYRYPALRPSEVERFFRSHARYYYYGGFYGPFWPAYHGYWGGWGWGTGWAYAPPPAAAMPAPRTRPPVSSGLLRAGGEATVAFFFPVAANAAKAIVFVAEVVGANGELLGSVQIPFVRGKAQPPRPPAAPAGAGPAQPPGPPPPPAPPATAPRAPEPPAPPAEPPDIEEEPAPAPGPGAPPAPGAPPPPPSTGSATPPTPGTAPPPAPGAATPPAKPPATASG